MHIYNLDVKHHGLSLSVLLCTELFCLTPGESVLFKGDNHEFFQPDVVSKFGLSFLPFVTERMLI